MFACLNYSSHIYVDKEIKDIETELSSIERQTDKNKIERKKDK